MDYEELEAKWMIALAEIAGLKRQLAESKIDNEELHELWAETIQENEELEAELAGHRSAVEVDDYTPLCQQDQHKDSSWPCPEICGEMCKYNNTSDCSKRRPEPAGTSPEHRSTVEGESEAENE